MWGEQARGTTFGGNFAASREGSGALDAQDSILRTQNRRLLLGRIPEPAIWIFDTVGLCVCIGVVGLSAGPSFIAGLQTTGISLVFVGLVSALLPHVVGVLFGRYVLKLNPLVVLGACAGAGTMTAALRAVQDEAWSSVPALGYTVPYAIGNILLAAWGPVIVAMMPIGR
jgi:putative transport protein